MYIKTNYFTIIGISILSQIPKSAASKQPIA